MAIVSLDENTLYIRSDDGSYVPFVGITEIKEIRQNPVEIQPSMTYSKLTFNSDMSFTITLERPIRKGLLDIICGRAYTKAAQRYVRLEKRQKEKQRRLELKHEARIHGDAR